MSNSSSFTAPAAPTPPPLPSSPLPLSPSPSSAPAMASSPSLIATSADSLAVVTTSGAFASSPLPSVPSSSQTFLSSSTSSTSSFSLSSSSTTASTILSSSTPITSTAVVIGSSTPNSATTRVVTSFTVVTPSTSTLPPSTQVVIVTPTPVSSPTAASSPSSTAPSSTPSAAGSLPINGKSSGSSGLSSAGTTAVAVVVPVVVVALLVILGIFFWRKRKQRKNAREERRKEVEEYGYNPNDDPTLPAVGGLAGSESPEMSEDVGYRGWGNTTNGTSARKPSTNLSSGPGVGMAVSEDGQGTRSLVSPSGVSDPLVDGANSGPAELGPGTAAGAAGMVSSKSGVHRGPSNASSTYSAAGRTDGSGEMHENNPDVTYGSNSYSEYTPYAANAGNTDSMGGQPVIKDVSARRNTRIENAGYAPPGNSGIAQNF